MRHGGDIYTVSELTGKSPYEILDMSSSVNPLPLPEKIKKKVIEKFPFLHKYPDTEARAFVRTLSELYDIPSEKIICGNGLTELIYLTVQALKPESVLLLEPTFTEYERACKFNDINDIERIFSLSKEKIIEMLWKTMKERKYAMVFICNPNNPTGWLIEKSEILKLASLYEDTIFVVDEAFIDFVPEESLFREVSPNIIVLRSLTKFYGLAGLRFGYAVASIQIVERIKKYRHPWSINSLAQLIAEEIIRDEDFKRQSYEFFKSEKDFFERSLNELKLKYFPSVANFYLFEIPKKGVFQYMIERGVLIRDCSNFYGLNENFIRVSVKSRAENERFFKEMKEFLRS
ncbi:threonine-phosphate decarboxylase CobD [Thermodesulfovibrio sp. 3907-1M]|uniref:threonine-phosphate decarboxylase n=1 Tax=Thermodesulfovibrio autotrophicus TaxID=3118333 RepID=A0AAU8H0I8_9BACT